MRLKDNKAYYKLNLLKIKNIIMIEKHLKYLVFIHQSLHVKRKSFLNSDINQKLLFIIKKNLYIGQPSWILNFFLYRFSNHGSLTQHITFLVKSEDTMKKKKKNIFLVKKKGFERC